MKVTSHMVIQALKAKHKEDVFVPECKDGPTAFGSHSRMDAWVMEKKWSHPRVVGYEVKVSRSDFLADNKWRAYLPLCNELIFVAPKGIIKQDELSPEVGLMELVGESRLVTRKKAQYREVVVPEELYRYILMCRVEVVSNQFKSDSAKDKFKAWLAEKKEDRKLGYNISRAVRDHVDRVEFENRGLKSKIDELDGVKRFMESLGINPNSHAYRWDVEDKYRAVKAVVPDDLQQALAKAKSALTAMELQLSKLEQKEAA